MTVNKGEGDRHRDGRGAEERREGKNKEDVDKMGQGGSCGERRGEGRAEEDNAMTSEDWKG